MTLMLSCPPSKSPDPRIALGPESMLSMLWTTFLALRKIVAFADRLCRARAHLFQLCCVGGPLIYSVAPAAGIRPLCAAG